MVLVVYDAKADGAYWLYVQHHFQSLADSRVRRNPRPTPFALVLLLAKAVHAAHQKGIVHRDLKPANVLLAPPADEPALNSAYGLPKVADFGLAKYLDGGPGLSTSSAIQGTPLYMAPEQASGEGKKVGPATDVWALGVILYELLAGQRPFQGKTPLDILNRIRSDPPRPLRETQPDVPAALEAICRRCLEKEPDKRYPTALALADDLARYLNGPPTPPPRPPKRRRLLAGAVILAGLGLLGG